MAISQLHYELKSLHKKAISSIESKLKKKVDLHDPFPILMLSDGLKFVPEKAADTEFVIGLMVDRDGSVNVITSNDDGESVYPLTANSFTIMDLITIHESAFVRS